MTRLLRYQVAMSLDGFIADSNGGYDWIVMDPAIDFAALQAEFDTIVMGRKSYEVSASQGGGGMKGIEVFVFSRTLPPGKRKGATVVAEDPAPFMHELKQRQGKDIWLYGGGELFRSMLDAGAVDTVEVAVIPVMLGSGVPLLPGGASQKLKLADQKTLPASGIIALSYVVEGGAGEGRPIRYVRE